MDKNKLKSAALVLIGVVIGAVIISVITPSKAPNVAVSSEPATQERKIKYYTGSMHPQVRLDRPGKCPICGMDLIPVYEDEAGGDGNVNLKLGERARKLAAIETEELITRKLEKDVYAVAKIDYDEKKVAYIAAWNNGRIDKLYVDFTGKKVKRGERLAKLYGPELISAQQEYLLTYKTRGINAKSKLLLLGITSSQIKKIEKAGAPLTHLTITSPITGTVISKNVKEGQYVKTGDMIFTIADLSNLWVFLDIYEYDLPWVKVGQTANITVDAYPEDEFEGIITFIDPFLSEKTRTIRVRIDVKNPGEKLKPGMFANAHIHKALMNAADPKQEKMLAIRKTAVLDTGVRKVAYVEVGEGEYAMREIVTGPLAGDYYQVISGLKEGERVVISGNFLIDSQMQLTGKPSIMFPNGLIDSEANAEDDDMDMDMDDISFE